MKNREDKIWDAITDSAKKRFDYQTVKNSFPTDEQNQELIADNIVWKIINYLQVKKSKAELSATIFTDLLMLGFKVDKVWLDNFIDDKDEAFKIEISVSKLATDMLNGGIDPDAVYFNLF